MDNGGFASQLEGGDMYCRQALCSVDCRPPIADSDRDLFCSSARFFTALSSIISRKRAKSRNRLSCNQKLFA